MKSFQFISWIFSFVQGWRELNFLLKFTVPKFPHKGSISRVKWQVRTLCLFPPLLLSGAQLQRAECWSPLPKCPVPSYLNVLSLTLPTHPPGASIQCGLSFPKEFWIGPTILESPGAQHLVNMVLLVAICEIVCVCVRVRVPGALYHETMKQAFDPAVHLSINCPPAEGGGASPPTSLCCFSSSFTHTSLYYHTTQSSLPWVAIGC